MREEFIKKAKNYYILGMFAEKKGMNSEAVANFFKSLFALADFIIFTKTEKIAHDHTERFELLKKHDKFLYDSIDGLFFIYRDTYTKEISLARIKFVKEKTDEAFKYAKIEKPAKEDMQ